MDLISLLIYLLATWRIASLLVHEGGPGRFFQHLRESTGIQHDDEGNILIVPESFLAELLSCVWCASIWVAGFWAVFDWVLPEISVRLALIFALSAGAIWVDIRFQAK